MEEGLEYQAAYEKGVEYYAGNFFLADGKPKYYHDRVYPIDIHAPSQAVVFFTGEDDYEIGLQPASLKISSPLDCLQSGPCREHVASEYLKIAWFLVYGWFV